MSAVLAELRTGNAPFDVERVRADFPILSRQVHGRPLVYLDSAASAQKPRQVIEAESRVYESEYANVHRGVHYLSQVATEKFEATRTRIAAFINAPDENEVVFTRGA
ncbi:MAG: aminotransferase class V-fold PLP-dependent enzyme, partial [Proteobacteria bacterium]|nr:aminotransferase class V-fold PLP-dependent enzyme [Pseudomonadota bacterium]